MASFLNICQKMLSTLHNAEFIDFNLVGRYIEYCTVWVHDRKMANLSRFYR